VPSTGADGGASGLPAKGEAAPAVGKDESLQSQSRRVPPVRKAAAADDRFKERRYDEDAVPPRRRPVTVPARRPERRVPVQLLLIALLLLASGAVALVMFLWYAPSSLPPDWDAPAVGADAAPMAPARGNLLRPVASNGWATLKGRVTLKGDRPDIEAMNKALRAAMEANQDAKHCLNAPGGETEQQTWRLAKDGGVGNVFVWLEPPDGHYFKIDWDKKPWPKEVVIDQPHCAFVPHAAVHFPGAYAPEKPHDLKPSGQKFIVRNSAPINHNTAWRGGDANPGDNKLIPSKDNLVAELRPDPEPVLIKCNIHTFMSAVVRVFDHPYAAVTDKDGNYEIKNAPAGAELRVIVWHEAAGYGNKGKEGDKVTLKVGKDNFYYYTITASK
jgi:hypothetical protein